MMLMGLAGCVSTPSPAPLATSAPFDVAGFFTGASRGAGVLRVVGRDPVPVRVESLGRIEEDGTLVLDQTIIEGAKAARARSWRLRPVGAGRWAGTLTDAVGPVEAVGGPGRLTIAYPAKNSVAIRQVLTMTSDGRSADNVLTARIAGVPVAVLRERITKGGG